MPNSLPTTYRSLLRVPIASVLALCAFTSWWSSGPIPAVQVQAHQDASVPAQVQVPAVPDPVPVAVDATTTALWVADFTPACPQDPTCAPALGPAAALLASARQAGARVIYTTIPRFAQAPAPDGQVAAAVRPQPGELIVPRAPAGSSGGQNMFPIRDVLRTQEIQTVILVGNTADLAILYGAYFLTDERYTVVVPLDGVGARSDFERLLTEYQLLHQLPANEANTPLLPGAVTLSKTDLITFTS